MEPQHHATMLLRRIADGDRSATEELFPLVYEELHRLARRYMVDQRADHTLQPTALVNEAYLKLVDVPRAGLKDRAHFFRLAATAMRSILVDHAKARRRQKRGGERLRVTMDEGAFAEGTGKGHDLVDLDGAISRLGGLDEQLGRIVELRFFGGLTSAQIGEVLDCSSKTVDRGWRLAQAWLKADLDRQVAG